MQYEHTVEVVIASAELFALSDEVTVLRLGQLVRRGTSRLVADLRIVQRRLGRLGRPLGSVYLTVSGTGIDLSCVELLRELFVHLAQSDLLVGVAETSLRHIVCRAHRIEDGHRERKPNEVASVVAHLIPKRLVKLP